MVFLGFLLTRRFLLRTVIGSEATLAYGIYVKKVTCVGGEGTSLIPSAHARFLCRCGNVCCSRRFLLRTAIGSEATLAYGIYIKKVTCVGGEGTSLIPISSRPFPVQVRQCLLFTTICGNQQHSAAEPVNKCGIGLASNLIC